MNAGLVARAGPSPNDFGWKLDGEVAWLRITNAGREAIGEPSQDLAPASGAKGATTGELDSEANAATSRKEPPIAPPSPRHRPKLRDAAATLLACWDATTEREPLADAVAALRAAMDPASKVVGSLRAPRQGTKQEAVLALLRRSEGATIANVVEATGWAQHTVRGFFAGLKKKGHRVEVLERVSQVGAGSAGTKGSYSIYRVAKTR